MSKNIFYTADEWKKMANALDKNIKNFEKALAYLTVVVFEAASKTFIAVSSNIKSTLIIFPFSSSI